MPLILAIEPDRRQAAQLSGVVRRRVGAELILVDTTERALDAIGSRVPDLVLVPALLSPQDDAALAAALRVIAAASQVQMLTIPVLAAPRPISRVGGVLSALRRDRSRPAEPDGCDPTVFAEQIASYLERAATERASAVADRPLATTEDAAPLAGAVDLVPVAPPALTATAQAAPTVEEEFATVEASATARQEFAAVEAVAAAEQEFAPVEEFVAAEQQFVPVEAVAAAGQEFAAVDAVAAAEREFAAVEAVAAAEREFAAVEAVAMDPFAERVEEAVENRTDLELTEAERQAAADESVSLAVEAAVWALFTGTLAPTPPVEPLSPAPFEDEEFISVLEDVPLPEIEASAGGDWVPPLVEEPDSVDIDLMVDAEELLTDGEETAVASHERTEGIVSGRGDGGDLLEAGAAEPPSAGSGKRSQDDDPWMPLRTISWRAWPGLEGLPAESAPEPASAVAPQEQLTSAAKSGREWVELIESLRHDVERLRVERSKPAPEPSAPRGSRPERKVKPVQDEWGFFDPEQCGFAALLAKLEEVTESEESSRT